MKQFSVAAIRNGKRLDAALRRSGQKLTKRQIASLLGLSPSQTQQAIDWCRANRVVTVDPFFALSVDGTWLYGYRSSVQEVHEFQIKEMNYLATRTRTNIHVLEHALSTNATLGKSMTSKERAYFKAQLTSLQAAKSALDAVGQNAYAQLVP